MTVKSIFYVLMATWGQFDCITPAMWSAEAGTNISYNHLLNLTPLVPRAPPPPPQVQEGHNERSPLL